MEDSCPDLQRRNTFTRFPIHVRLEGITRIASEEQLTSYSYVQLAHILEHVPSPAHNGARTVSYDQALGYLFIEVPQDLSDERNGGLIDGDAMVAFRSMSTLISIPYVRSVN